MTQRTLGASILSFLGGLWMLAACRRLYGGLGRMPLGWRPHHTGWERGMMWHAGWPWVGITSGTIVIICAIALYCFPQYRRSLGITILAISLVNLFFGVGGFMVSVLGILGGIVALAPRDIPQA